MKTNGNAKKEPVMQPVKPEPKQEVKKDIVLSVVDKLKFLLFQEKINKCIERKNSLMAQMALFQLQFNNCRDDSGRLDVDAKKIEEDRMKWLKDRSKHYGVNLDAPGLHIDDDTGKVTLPENKA